MGEIPTTTQTDDNSTKQVRAGQEGRSAGLKVWYPAWTQLAGQMIGRGAPLHMPTKKQFHGVHTGVLNFRKNYGLLHDNTCADNQLLLKQHLAFTLFVPAGRADRAYTAIERLTKKGMLNGKTPKTASPIIRVIESHVRFPAQKARRLLRALDILPGFCKWAQQNKGEPIQQFVDRCHDYLLKYMPGMGMKASAHFMRNVGIWTTGYGRAIIDVHIHKALEAFNFKHATYDEAEQSFFMLSQLTGLPVLLLDAYLWCAYSGNWELESADFGNFDKLNG